MSTAAIECEPQAADALAEVMAMYQAEPVELLVGQIDMYPAKDVRDSLSDANLKSIAAAAALPPILVIKTAEGKLHVSDGCHRLTVARQKGRHRIMALVAEGTAEDAFRHSCVINDRHGLATTDTDKKTRIKNARRMWPDYPTRRIAELCGVDQSYVVRLDAEAKESADSLMTKAGTLMTSHQGTGAPTPPPIPNLKRKALQCGRKVVPSDWIAEACKDIESHPATRALSNHEVGRQMGVPTNRIIKKYRERARAAASAPATESAPTGDPEPMPPAPAPPAEPPPRTYRVNFEVAAADLPGLARRIAAVLTRPGNLTPAEFRRLVELLAEMD